MQEEEGRVGEQETLDSKSGSTAIYIEDLE